MILYELELENFRCFTGGPHTVDFTNPALGLVLITGSNKFNPRLQSNGVGKSSILHGIAWTLFGTTLPQNGSSLKGKDILNWHSDGADTVRGALRLKVYGSSEPRICTVERTWNPISLKIDGVQAKQEELEQLLGVNFAAFQNSIAFGQDGRFFLDMKPAEKMQILSEVQNLDEWDKAAKRSSDILKEAQADLQEAINIKSRLEGEKTEVEANIASNTKMAATFESTNAEYIETLRTQLDSEVLTPLVRLKCDLNTAMEVFMSESACYEQHAKDTSSAFDEYAEAETAYNLNRNKKKSLEHKLEEIVDRINLLKTTSNCFECGQELLENKAADMLTAQEEKRLELLSEISELDIEFLPLKEHLDEKKDIHTVRSNRGDIPSRGRIDLLQRKVSDLTNLVREKENKKAKIEGTIEEALKKENPYHSLADQNLKKLQATCEKIKEQEATISLLESEIGSCKEWTKRFKDIKLDVLNQTVATLELEINQSIIALGLDGWIVKLETEKENKSGGIARGLHVLISNGQMGTDNFIPFSAWSGGEAQRLKLAGSIGLSNLILNSKGIESNVEFYDEPSKSLSEQGIKDLIDTLAARAQSENKSIYFIDHHSISSGQFSGTLKLVKDEDGNSQITQETY